MSESGVDSWSEVDSKSKAVWDFIITVWKVLAKLIIGASTYRHKNIIGKPAESDHLIDRQAYSGNIGCHSKIISLTKNYKDHNMLMGL